MIYRGVFPVAPTVFDAHGHLDLDGQKRCIDFMIDAGSHGICILANWSEQFALTDVEREAVMDCVLKHNAGRVPIIVTTTHFSADACAERSIRAQEAGASMVMIMPPYHGATIRATESAIYEFFKHVSDAITIPIMIQDAPVAGTPLSVPLLARMAAVTTRSPPRHGCRRTISGDMSSISGPEASSAPRISARTTIASQFPCIALSQSNGRPSLQRQQETWRLASFGETALSGCLTGAWRQNSPENQNIKMD